MRVCFERRNSVSARICWVRVRLALGLFALALVFVPAARSQSSDEPMWVDVGISDSSGRALDAFHSALHRVADERGHARVLVYGASHTASDTFTGELRRRLQADYGDAGPGWVLPGIPFSYYQHAEVEIEARGWRGLKVRGADRTPEEYGYAGFALEGGNARGTLRTTRAFSTVELHYLRAPGAGHVVLFVDGERVAAAHANGTRAGRVLSVQVSEGQHQVEVRTWGGDVRVFGVVLEREQPGVVVDAFGVPGARIWDQEPWQVDVLRTQLRRRPPDLVAFAYGTNETANRHVDMQQYRSRLSRALRRWKRLAPQASCLLIGPGEWPRRVRGVFRPRPRTAQVVAVQRRVARAQGCAFFDTLAMMGGTGSMERWVRHGWALGDHVHFTDIGYRTMGRALDLAIRPR